MSILGQFQFRRDVASAWTSANPILLDGEMGIESDTDKFKIGDGVTAWNALPYGGVKGDTGNTGATGAAGISPTVTVGATTVVTPATSPSVTDADASPNADLRFSLPRARNVSAGTTTTGNAGTNAAVASVQNGDGDVTLNFTIPRGDTGATGATGPAANAFTNIAVTGQNTVSAEQANDTLTLVAGTNISLVTNDATDSITINSTSVATNGFGVITGNTGTATADTPTDTLAITGGTGISTTATDTPDGLVITNTGVTSVSVNGGAAQTGDVSISTPPAGTDNTAVTRTAPTASASTALTTLISFPITGGSIVAGSEFEFSASLRVINTTTATNSVVTLSVGATNILVLTQANGGTAAAAPGAAVFVRGRITFYSATAAEAVIHFGKSQAVAANIFLNTSASATVVTAANTTLDLKYNTSGTTATFICRQATIQRVK